MAYTDQWFREEEEEERRRRAAKRQQQQDWNAFERPALSLPQAPQRSALSEPAVRSVEYRDTQWFKQQAAQEQHARWKRKEEGTRPLQEYEMLAHKMGEDKLADRLHSVFSLWKVYMDPVADQRVVWDLVNSTYDLRTIEQMLRRATRTMYGDPTKGQDYMVPREWMVAHDLDPDDPTHASLAAFAMRQEAGKIDLQNFNNEHRFLEKVNQNLRDNTAIMANPFSAGVVVVGELVDLTGQLLMGSSEETAGEVLETLEAASSLTAVGGFMAAWKELGRFIPAERAEAYQGKKLSIDRKVWQANQQAAISPSWVSSDIGLRQITAEEWETMSDFDRQAYAMLAYYSAETPTSVNDLLEDLNQPVLAPDGTIISEGYALDEVPSGRLTPGIKSGLYEKLRDLMRTTREYQLWLFREGYMDDPDKEINGMMGRYADDGSWVPDPVWEQAMQDHETDMERWAQYQEDHPQLAAIMEDTGLPLTKQGAKAMWNQISEDSPLTAAYHLPIKGFEILGGAFNSVPAMFDMYLRQKADPTYQRLEDEYDALPEGEEKEKKAEQMRARSGQMVNEWWGANYYMNAKLLWNWFDEDAYEEGMKFTLENPDWIHSINIGVDISSSVIPFARGKLSPNVLTTKSVKTALKSKPIQKIAPLIADAVMADDMALVTKLLFGSGAAKFIEAILKIRNGTYTAHSPEIRSLAQDITTAFRKGEGAEAIRTRFNLGENTLGVIEWLQKYVTETDAKRADIDAQDMPVDKPDFGRVVSAAEQGDIDAVRSGLGLPDTKAAGRTAERVIKRTGSMRSKPGEQRQAIRDRGEERYALRETRERSRLAESQAAERQRFEEKWANLEKRGQSGVYRRTSRLKDKDEAVKQIAKWEKDFQARRDLARREMEVGFQEQEFNALPSRLGIVRKQTEAGIALRQGRIRDAEPTELMAASRQLYEVHLQGTLKARAAHRAARKNIEDVVAKTLAGRQVKVGDILGYRDVHPYMARMLAAGYVNGRYGPILNNLRHHKLKAPGHFRDSMHAIVRLGGIRGRLATSFLKKFDIRVPTEVEVGSLGFVDNVRRWALYASHGDAKLADKLAGMAARISDATDHAAILKFEQARDQLITTFYKNVIKKRGEFVEDLSDNRLQTAMGLVQGDMEIDGAVVAKAGERVDVVKGRPPRSSKDAGIGEYEPVPIPTKQTYTVNLPNVYWATLRIDADPRLVTRMLDKVGAGELINVGRATGGTLQKLGTAVRIPTVFFGSPLLAIKHTKVDPLRSVIEEGLSSLVAKTHFRRASARVWDEVAKVSPQAAVYAQWMRRRSMMTDIHYLMEAGGKAGYRVVRAFKDNGRINRKGFDAVVQDLRRMAMDPVFRVWATEGREGVIKWLKGKDGTKFIEDSGILQGREYAELAAGRKLSKKALLDIARRYYIERYVDVLFESYAEHLPGITARLKGMAQGAETITDSNIARMIHEVNKGKSKLEMENPFAGMPRNAHDVQGVLLDYMSRGVGIAMTSNRGARNMVWDKVYYQTYRRLTQKEGMAPDKASDVAAEVASARVDQAQLSLARAWNVEAKWRFMAFFATKTRLWGTWIGKLALKRPGYAMAVDEYMKWMEERNEEQGLPEHMKHNLVFEMPSGAASFLNDLTYYGRDKPIAALSNTFLGTDFDPEKSTNTTFRYDFAPYAWLTPHAVESELGAAMESGIAEVTNYAFGTDWKPFRDRFATPTEREFSPEGVSDDLLTTVFDPLQRVAPLIASVSTILTASKAGAFSNETDLRDVRAFLDKMNDTEQRVWWGAITTKQAEFANRGEELTVQEAFQAAALSDLMYQATRLGKPPSTGFISSFDQEYNAWRDEYAKLNGDNRHIMLNENPAFAMRMNAGYVDPTIEAVIAPMKNEYQEAVELAAVQTDVAFKDGTLGERIGEITGQLDETTDKLLQNDDFATWFYGGMPTEARREFDSLRKVIGTLYPFSDPLTVLRDGNRPSQKEQQDYRRDKEEQWEQFKEDHGLVAFQQNDPLVSYYYKIMVQEPAEVYATNNKGGDAVSAGVATVASYLTRAQNGRMKADALLKTLNFERVASLWKGESNSTNPLMGALTPREKEEMGWASSPKAEAVWNEYRMDMHLALEEINRRAISIHTTEAKALKAAVHEKYQRIAETNPEFKAEYELSDTKTTPVWRRLEMIGLADDSSDYVLQPGGRAQAAQGWQEFFDILEWGDEQRSKIWNKSTREYGVSYEASDAIPLGQYVVDQITTLRWENPDWYEEFRSIIQRNGGGLGTFGFKHGQHRSPYGDDEDLWDKTFTPDLFGSE